MTHGVFITGTDTDSGKTHVSVAVLRTLAQRGLRVAGFKPIAAGAERSDGKLQNDDALALRAASNVVFPYATINPYCFAPPISPHLAAADAGVRIDPRRLVTALDAIRSASDFVVVEGAGGWRVPLSDDLDVAGLARLFGLPVVLVVGLRLGCLNHAQLSEQVIQATGMPLLGWIASQVDPDMDHVEQNLDTLNKLLCSPCLGVLAHTASRTPLDARAFLDVDCLHT